MYWLTGHCAMSNLWCHTVLRCVTKGLIINYYCTIYYVLSGFPVLRDTNEGPKSACLIQVSLYYFQIILYVVRLCFWKRIYEPLACQNLPTLTENPPCLAAGVGLVVVGGLVTTNRLQSPGVNRISSSAISPAYPRPLSASNTICNVNKLVDDKLHYLSFFLGRVEWRKSKKRK